MNIPRTKTIVIEEDKARQYAFNAAYGIDCKIRSESHFDETFNNTKFVIEFETPDQKYKLTEIYKDGNDNSTDYVLLEAEKNGASIKETLKRYIDAELSVVQLMKS